ncbi:MAG TPA: hypothetical protein VGM03_16385, partial [Phycisphaerae bacterium]
MQAPPRQEVPSGQTLPQLPQFTGSSSRYAQAPEHAVRPGGHGWHAEFWHTSPAAQAFPHVPQFALSLAVKVHVPLQFVKPAGQAQFGSAGLSGPLKQPWNTSKSS